MAEKRGQYVYNDDGTVSQLVSISGADSNGSGLAVTTGDILPVDIQSRYASTIQTHNAVSVALSSGSRGSWIDCDGFTEICANVLSDLGTNSYRLIAEFSTDGVTQQGQKTILADGTGATRSDSISLCSRYVRFYIVNNDAGAAHTMSAWAYLKS